MFEPILISEFGEEMQDINSCLEELVRVVRGFAQSGMSAAEADAAVREFSRCAAPVLRERKLRRMHPKRRPPRTREGFARRWVVPQLQDRSTPERDISGGGCLGHFYIFPKQAAVDKAAAADLKGASSNR